MTPTTREIRAVLDDVANALQVAAPLSTTLRRLVGDAAQQAVDLEAAIDRAVRAIRRLQPGGQYRGKQQ
jgi:thioesterase domain-containing protein